MDQTFNIILKLIENTPVLMAILLFQFVLCLAPSAGTLFLIWVQNKTFARALESAIDVLERLATTVEALKERFGDLARKVDEIEIDLRLKSIDPGLKSKEPPCAPPYPPFS